MFVKSSQSISFLAFAAAILLLSGCGDGHPKTAPVRGKVTYKGQPVPRGSISFIPDGGAAATGEIGPDGSYTLTTFRKDDGAILGPHKVVITAMQDTQGIEAWGKLPPPIVPAKYMNLLTSGLQAEVQDRENVCNFDLEDPKKK